jgi:hypothetical protein
VHRGRPGFPVICWRSGKTVKTLNSSVDINSNTELELSHGEITQVKDKNEVNDVAIRTEMEKDKDEGEEGKGIENNDDNKEISAENSETQFHRKVIRILPDNNGTLYSIEASVQGAHF